MKSQVSENLAQALKRATSAAKGQVVKHSDLEAVEVRLLKRAGFLTPVIRGWYLLSRPEVKGSSSAWFIGFWPFVKYYLEDRFGNNGYCLGAETSLDLHVGEKVVPKQVIVLTKKVSNQSIDLPHGMSLMLYCNDKNFPEEVEFLNGLNAMSLPLAISRLSPSYFRNKPINVEIALKMLPSVSQISRVLLEKGATVPTGRIIGALRKIGNAKEAERIIGDMAAAGYAVREATSFGNYVARLDKSTRITSPFSGRMEAMWNEMRECVMSEFPKAPGIKNTRAGLIEAIRERYKQDAYHSLSIEGYKVSEELIQRIASGKWAPVSDAKDAEETDALAAKGYDNTFKVILKNVKEVVQGKVPGVVFEDSLHVWYRELFYPSVRAGLIKASALSGYRNSPVYISGSRYIPPSKEVVPGAMDLLFALLKGEKEPSVRAILGHFAFVYIHPYMDGNGRLARFLMNLMLVSGGYEWTIIRSDRRSEYMKALEDASVKGKICPFTRFVRSELDYWSKGLK